MNINVLHVDDILHTLNHRGKYQILLTIMACLGVPPACMQLLNNVFIIGNVPHQCAVPDNGSSLWEKYIDVDNVSLQFDQCEIIVSSHDEVIAKEPCPNGIEFLLPTKVSVASEFGLVCDHSALAKLSQTLVIGGQGIGAFLITIFSDRFGRTMGLVFSNLGILVCGLVITFAPNFIVFAIFKFIMGGFQQGVLTSCSTFILELFPRKDRRVGTLLIGVIWGVSACSMPLFAYLLRHESWRYLQLTLTLTSVAVFLQMWLMDESIRWLLANGKTKRALKCIKRAARYNGKNYKDVLKALNVSEELKPLECEKTANQPSFSADAANNPDGVETRTPKEAELEKNMEQTAAKKMSFLDLLRVRRLLLNAMSIWVAWFTVALGYFAIYLTATSLHGDRYVNFTLVAMMTIPSRLLCYLIVNRFGRKMSVITVYSLMGFGIFTGSLFKYLETYKKEVFGPMVVVSSMIGMLGASGCFGMVFFYTPEIFPTNFRNQALGTSSLVGRFGGMLAPFTGVLAEKAAWSPGVLMGGLTCLVILLVWNVLPETKSRELPQTQEELEMWYKDKKTEENSTGA